MATFVLTITVDDDNHINAGVRAAAYELYERMQEDIEPADLDVDEQVELIDTYVQAQLSRID